MTTEKNSKSYTILLTLLTLIARLPFWVLYRLSDVTFVLLYFVVRYRRKAVTRNLAESFPNISPKERNRIRRKFYLNFSDYIFETIKLLHISDEQIRQRMTFSGMKMTDNYLRQNRPVVAYFSHCGNWEWAPSITLWSELKAGKDTEFCQIYRPLRNTTMDRLMLHIRSRFGSVSLQKRLAFLDLLRFRKNGMPTITGFMSDQKPSHGDAGHIVHFLNHPTAIITGTEIVARRLNAAVVYWDMSKTARGHYHIDMKLITDAPNELPENAITARYANLLQQTITRQPDIWLWSHKRWKNPVSFPQNNDNSNE